MKQNLYRGEERTLAENKKKIENRIFKRGYIFCYKKLKYLSIRSISKGSLIL